MIKELEQPKPKMCLLKSFYDLIYILIYETKKNKKREEDIQFCLLFSKDVFDIIGRLVPTGFLNLKRQL